MARTRMRVTMGISLMMVMFAATACAAGAASESVQPGSTEPSETTTKQTDPTEGEESEPAARDPNTLLQLGDSYNEIPSSIGDYRLLTPELVAREAMSCSDSPLNGYSDGIFWSFEGTTAKLIYVTDEGIANTSEGAGYCWTIGPAVAEGLSADADETFPGVIELILSSMEEPQEDADIECNSTELVTNCSKRYPGLINYVSVKAAVEADTDAQDLFLSQFLNTFVQAHPMVAVRTAGFPDMH